MSPIRPLSPRPRRAECAARAFLPTPHTDRVLPRRSRPSESLEPAQFSFQARAALLVAPATDTERGSRHRRGADRPVHRDLSAVAPSKPATPTHSRGDAPPDRDLSHRTAPAAEVLLGRKKGTDGGRGRGPAGHHAAQQRHQSVLPSTHARQEQGARTHAGPAQPRVDPLATAPSNVPAASTSLALKTHTHDR